MRKTIPWLKLKQVTGPSHPKMAEGREGRPGRDLAGEVAGEGGVQVPGPPGGRHVPARGREEWEGRGARIWGHAAGRGIP